MRGTPEYLTFGHLVPFLDILSKSIQTETQPIWKPILQSTQHKRNQLATAKHVDTVSLQSQKIRSIQNSVPYLYTYARARVSNMQWLVFEKKIFSKFFFYSTWFRYKKNSEQIFTTSGGCAHCWKFFQVSARLRKKYEKEGTKVEK